jgi:hypothetical protein
MQVKIAKFNLYPKDEPTSYAVGFSVELDNGRSFYRDTTVSLEDATGKTDSEIAQLAYAELREGILATAEVEGAKSPIIGEIVVDEEE